MIIKDAEKWEYYNCPYCNKDIIQEEIDAMHCNNCNRDMFSINRATALLSNDPSNSSNLPPSAEDMLKIKDLLEQKKY